MAGYEDSEPVEVVDRLLYRDAQQIFLRHSGQDQGGRCHWCGFEWPCPARRLAERAAAASCQPWRDSWTVRHDLNGMPGWPPPRGYHHNGGLFD
jgi:hypothetical protein